VPKGNPKKITVDNQQTMSRRTSKRKHDTRQENGTTLSKNWQNGGKHATKSVYLVNVNAVNAKVIQEMVEEVNKQDFGFDSQEMPPNAEVLRTKEEFPSTWEMDDAFTDKIRFVISPVLKQWASAYEDLKIPLTFDDDDVSRAIYH
jgi:hypothetical protein